MEIVRLADAPPYDPEQLVARPLLDGSRSNMRIIRLAPGQVLPPHTHGASDLMLYVVEGDGVLETDEEIVDFPAGSLAFYRGEEELRVATPGKPGSRSWRSWPRRSRPEPRVDGPLRYDRGMCRSIRTLHNFEPPATDEEIHSAALQYVRKISGTREPSRANREAFELAVATVTEATRTLVDSLVTAAPPRDREVEAAKAKARAAQRYA
jgi:hypothetical protein